MDRDDTSSVPSGMTSFDGQKSTKAAGDNQDALGSSSHSGSLSRVARMPVSMDSDFYNMDHKRRGFAIIFNHEVFEIRTFENRLGTRVDCDNLEETLKYIGFQVAIYNDLNHQELSEVIEQVAQEDHSDCDAFVLAVMSHGDVGILYAKDLPYKTESLWSRFTADKCPTLAGKPKLFFIQACRGDQLDSGISLTRTETDGSYMSYKIPTQADFLIAFSTVPGFYSWRNPAHGSWFIQALCSQLKKHGFDRDILTVMTFVCRQVAIDFESNCPCIPRKHNQKQVPCITTMLTRLLQFAKKEEEEI